MIMSPEITSILIQRSLQLKYSLIFICIIFHFINAAESLHTHSRTSKYPEPLRTNRISSSVCKCSVKKFLSLFSQSARHSLEHVIYLVGEENRENVENIVNKIQVKKWMGNRCIGVFRLFLEISKYNLPHLHTNSLELSGWIAKSRPPQCFQC